MKPFSTPEYGDAPLGVECAFPGQEPRVARVVVSRPGVWQRLIYRIKFGVRIPSAGREYRAV